MINVSYYDIEVKTRSHIELQTLGKVRRICTEKSKDL